MISTLLLSWRAVTKMRTERRSGTGSLFLGSLAMGLIVAGGLVLVDQLITWVRHREWETVTLRSLFVDDNGNTSIPMVSGWLRESSPAGYQVVYDLFDFVPLWTFLVLLGAAIAVRMARVRS